MQGGSASTRRVLTALNYDLVGSTRLLNALDIEDYKDLITDFQNEVHRAVTALSGRMQDIEGDGGMATFPVDIDARDAASLAIQAGFEIIAGCRRVGVRRRRADLHVRVGIATSLSLVQDAARLSGAPKVTGAALAMATRLQTLAMPDTVMVSEETRSLARRAYRFQSQGARTMAGFSAAEEIWRAIGHRRQIDRYFAFGRLNAKLINRVDELDELRRSWNLAVQGMGQAILIEGEAGIGKSRLVHKVRAFMRGQRSRRILVQCHPSGTRTTLHPILQALPRDEEGGGRVTSLPDVKRLFRENGIYDEEAIDVLGYLLGAEEAGAGLKDAGLEAIREKADRAAVRCIEALCSEGPLLLLIEDIHWIDPTSLQLLKAALVAIETLPVLVVMTSRPTAERARLTLPHTRLMPLQPLASKDARNVIIAKFPKHAEAGGEALLELVEQVSGGVPLYIEEICQWAGENLQLAREALGKSQSPNRLSAFEAVVTARLAQLGPAAQVARAAAVAGFRFDAELLQKTLPDRTLADVAAGLQLLAGQGFVIEVSLSEPGLFGFRHALIRETIYKSLLRAERQGFHRSLYRAVDENRGLAPWIDLAGLADHAENAGLFPEAIECLLTVGAQNAQRSAMTEARQLLEHALALSNDISERAERETFMLRSMASLGPVLTTSEGPGSEPAQKLYETGIELARRRPAQERARWFPIYWGWWFTGADVNGERAHALLREMKDVESAEVQLQTRHCVWAIDFYLGHHGTCITCVDEALPLYEGHAELRNPAQYGGHDTKVCGLVHRGLSMWFKGHAAEAVSSMQLAKAWARETSHIGSMAHALINSAMLAAYRRDLPQLTIDIAELKELTAKNRMPTLLATAQILEGWQQGVSGELTRGLATMNQGLETHRKLQTPEDYPVYCTMLAELLMLNGEAAKAKTLLASLSDEKGDASHLYWKAEVYRRRAQVLALTNASEESVTEELAQSLRLAVEQGAVPLLLQSHETLQSFRAAMPLAARYQDEVDAARRVPDGDVPLFALPERISIGGRGP